MAQVSRFNAPTLDRFNEQTHESPWNLTRSELSSLLLNDVMIGRMKPKKVRLFIKPFCGWCDDAREWLDERGIEYDVLDVIADARARREMFELSGQTLAPVIEVDGNILADFGADELDAFWNELGLETARQN